MMESSWIDLIVNALVDALKGPSTGVFFPLAILEGCMVSDIFLDNIAQNIITAFLMLFNLAPSEGDSTEVKNEGAYRIYSTQVKIPSGAAIDMENMYQELSEYLRRFNSTPTVTAKFYPHHIEGYRCPCGCGEYLYVVFYTV